MVRTRIFSGVTVIALAGFWSGCAQIQESMWSTSSTTERPTDVSQSSGQSKTGQPRTGQSISTTGVATLTGAAVGGGIGMVIGATAGNAGEGLAVGALIGSAAGAGLGYQIQGQEERLHAQRAKVVEQGQVISQQGQELSELRHQASDRYPISDLNQSSLSGGRGRMNAGVSSLSPSAPRTIRGQRYERVDVASLSRQASPQIESASASALADSRPVSNGVLNNRGLSGSSALSDRAQPPMRVVSTADGSGALVTQSVRPPTATLPSFSTAPVASAVRGAVQEQNLAYPNTLARTPAQPAFSQAPAAQRMNELPAPPTEQIAQSTLRPTVPAASELPAANTMPPARGAIEEAQPVVVEDSSDEDLTEVAAGAEAVAETEPATMPVSQPARVSGTLPAIGAVHSGAAKADAIAPKRDALATDLARAIPQNANCSDAEQEAGRARSSNSDADKLFYFRRAIRLCPEQPDFYVEIGKVYVNIGRTQDAQSEFNKALELDPENERAQEELNMIMLGATY